MIYFTQGFADNPLPQVPDNVTKLFGLALNHMRGRVEETHLIAVSESRQELLDLLEHERVASYMDARFRKEFRQGGVLEWFNPPGAPVLPDGTDAWGHGIIELHRDGWRRVMPAPAPTERNPYGPGDPAEIDGT